MDKDEAYKVIETALKLARSKEETIIYSGTPSLDHGVYESALVALQALKPQEVDIEYDFPYTATFNAIHEAVTITGPNALGISVRAFQDSFNGAGVAIGGTPRENWRAGIEDRQQCRDCADFGPICPNTGEACDPRLRPAPPAAKAG